MKSVQNHFKLMPLLTMSVLLFASNFCLADPTPPKNVISMDKALGVAMKAQAGELKDKELEFENNIWIYSIEILGQDKKIHEVNVDALTGKIVSREIETPKNESREEKEDLAADKKVPATGYKVFQKVSLPGDGGWDFLAIDGVNRRLYVTHADRVQVLDADTLKPVGTIENVKRPHGVVLLPEVGKGYISSGDPGSVVVFDIKTLKRLSEIPSHKDTDVILYDASSKMIFTFNGDSHDATVIDPSTDKVVKFLDLGGAPEFAVSDGKGYVYDNLEDKSEVLRISTKTIKIEKHWALKPGESPSGMAMDVQHHRLFIGCRNKRVVVMNSRNGHIVQTLPIGEHVDATYFDPGSQTLFNSCGDGTLSVIHEDSPNKFHVVENAATEPGARTMVFDEKTGRIFTDAAKTMELSPTADHPKYNRKIVPGTFHVLAIGK